MRDLRLFYPKQRARRRRPWACAYCGQPIIDRREGRGGRPKYCDERCKERAHTARVREIRERTVPARRCALCGRETPSRHHVYCSDLCRWLSRGHPRSWPVQRRCGTCGLTIRGNRRYCSKECRRVAARARHAAQQRLREARCWGPEAERIDPLVVYERDGWICGICGLAVDRDRKHPDPWSVSLDHVVPLSRGGAHVYANVQCAHFRCNIRKSDTVEVVQGATA